MVKHKTIEILKKYSMCRIVDHEYFKLYSIEHIKVTRYKSTAVWISRNPFTFPVLTET